jgi:hypothetical protein
MVATLANLRFWMLCAALTASTGWANPLDWGPVEPRYHAQATPVAPEAQVNGEAGDAAPPYNWRGLLLQSLEFNVIENGFRVASDHNMRDQLAHKPFWRDYANSLDHFQMNRWNDGDDFLVNYLGHSMQGAVGADLEIQNSPRDARIRWGESGYGWSRFRGFLWSVVYSTHSEISPIGEAGIGNEGGFTYGAKCMDKCTPANFIPGVSKYTNNTGWVDFIVTPIGGMLIVVAEDIVDKKISDPLTGRLANHPLAARILRGTLNPARSWTNLLRARAPWYRDYEHGWPERNTGIHRLKSDEEVAWQKSRPRFSLSPHFSGFSLATNTNGCTNCRNTVTGGGVEFSAQILPWLALDSDVSYQPGASPLAGDRAGGNMTTAFFGVRTGIQTRNYALQVALRPGFVQFDQAQQTSPTTTIIYPLYPGTTVNATLGATTVNPPPRLGSITHFAWNVNLSGDYGITRFFSLRASMGENLIRYRTQYVDPPGDGKPPYESYLSRENFLNRNAWSFQVGPVFSF